MRKRHRRIGMGGTFDHFHLGHQHFIQSADQWAESLVIGVTSDQFTHKKAYSEEIQSYYQRAQSVRNFCQKNGIRCQVIELVDAYGPTLDNAAVEAICVTEETVPGADKINEVRTAMHLAPLPVYISTMIKDETGRILHADRIRAGEVNREGQVYLSHFTRDKKLSESQRAFFSKTIGQLVEQPQPQTKTVVVGDTSLAKFIAHQWPYQVAFYDLFEQRQPTQNQALVQLKPDLEIDNPAGTISFDLIKTAHRWHQFKHIKINGEEDLATLALVLTLPLGSLVYYGQPDQGSVEVQVTEAVKNTVFENLVND